MHDERADHAHHFLHGHVRVVEKSSFLVQRELVDVASAGRRSASCEMPGTPSMSNGMSKPCQCMEVGSGKWLSTMMRTRSPCRAWIVGPGALPL